MKKIFNAKFLKQNQSQTKEKFFAFYLKTKNYKLKTESGFGLLEAMVSIFVMITGVVGALTLVSAGINNLGASKSRLIATNLAQEGLEIVHNIRDTNWLDLATPAWNDWDGDALPDSCLSASPCLGYVNWDSANLAAWPEPAGGLIWDDDAGVKHYVYNPITPIGESFSRKVIIADLGDLNGDTKNDYSRVQVIVGWGPSGSCAEAGISIDRKFCLTLEERLYDWLQ